MSAGRQPVTPGEAASILRLHHVEGWPVGTIGAQIGRHHDTVEGCWPMPVSACKSR